MTADKTASWSALGIGSTYNDTKQRYLISLKCFTILVNVIYREGGFGISGNQANLLTSKLSGRSLKVHSTNLPSLEHHMELRNNHAKYFY